MPLQNKAQECITTSPPAGEMMTYQGVNHVQTLHGPAIIGQRAIFCHYIDVCRIRQNTGEVVLRVEGRWG